MYYPYNISITRMSMENRVHTTTLHGTYTLPRTHILTWGWGAVISN
jgi:hypothetical protein